MKKIIFVTSIMLIFLFIISCPSEIVKKTYWEGKVDGDFGWSDSEDSHDIKLYIHDN